MYDYSIHGTVLNRVFEVNDLGVVLDTQLTFNSHRTNVINRANRQLGFMTKIARDFTDPYCFKSLYCALVRSILEFAAVVWTPHQVSWILRLERVQKRFHRIALRNLAWRDPGNLPAYPERCSLIGLDTLQFRRKKQQAVFVAKILNGEINSPNMLAQLNFHAPVRSLRHSSLLQIRSHRTAYGFNEPWTAMIRTFRVVEYLHEFDEPSTRFAARIQRSAVL